MIINFKTLPNEILKKIPYSIRNKVDSINLYDLPPEVAYELKDYSEPEKYKIEIDKNVYDVIPEITIYNDFKFLTTKKQAVIEYIKNYLLIKKGSYPFDPEVGNNFHKYLQLLDRNVTNLMISNEFNELKSVIQNLFNVNVDFKEYSMNKEDTGVGVSYNLNVSIQVENEELSFSTILL